MFNYTLLKEGISSLTADTSTIMDVMTKRLSATPIKLGACAYDWRTKRPSKYHVDPILDVEDFCRRLLDRALDSWGMFFRPDEYDDTLSELITQVWKLEKHFDPDKASSFSAYASWIISQRAVDYGPRRVLGRHGTRTHNYAAQDFDEGDQMGEALDRFALDSENDSDPDVQGLLRERNSEILERHHQLGFDQDGQSPLGDI